TTSNRALSGLGLARPGGAGRVAWFAREERALSIVSARAAQPDSLVRLIRPRDCGAGLSGTAPGRRARRHLSLARRREQAFVEGGQSLVDAAGCTAETGSVSSGQALWLEKGRALAEPVAHFRTP